jgi:hypothetical protein
MSYFRVRLLKALKSQAKIHKLNYLCLRPKMYWVAI